MKPLASSMNGESSSVFHAMRVEWSSLKTSFSFLVCVHRRPCCQGKMCVDFNVTDTGHTLTTGAVINETRSGGITFNDTVQQSAGTSQYQSLSSTRVTHGTISLVDKLPFAGVGESGCECFPLTLGFALTIFAQMDTNLFDTRLRNLPTCAALWTFQKSETASSSWSICD